MRGRGTLTRRGFAAAALPLHERAVLTHQQVEMGALLVREFQEDLLALRVLEALAVLLEEPVRVPLAADADQEGLLIVDAAQQTIRPFGEQSVCRTLEEEKRRARLELGVTGQQLAIPCFELAEVLLFFRREILEDLAAARIARYPRSSRIELEPAAFGRNRNAQCVAREQEIRVAGLRRGVAASPALLACAVNLDDAL